MYQGHKLASQCHCEACILSKYLTLYRFSQLKGHWCKKRPHKCTWKEGREHCAQCLDLYLARKEEGNRCCTRLSRTLVPALLWQLCRSTIRCTAGAIQTIPTHKSIQSCRCLKTNPTSDEDGACSPWGEYLSPKNILPLYLPIWVRWCGQCLIVNILVRLMPSLTFEAFTHFCSGLLTPTHRPTV